MNIRHFGLNQYVNCVRLSDKNQNIVFWFRTKPFKTGEITNLLATIIYSNNYQQMIPWRILVILNKRRLQNEFFQKDDCNI